MQSKSARRKVSTGSKGIPPSLQPKKTLAKTKFSDSQYVIVSGQSMNGSGGGITLTLQSRSTEIQSLL